MYVDISNEDKYIEFTKNENNIYGNYISNFSPEEAYYIITDYSIVFYYSLDSLNKSSYLFDGFCYPYFPTETDTFVLGLDGWFTDSSLYKDYYFIKFEDE